MDEVLRQLHGAAVRYLLIGGQAMRLLGMPRYSMDWDFFIPPRDETNIARLNELLGGELRSRFCPWESAGRTSCKPSRLAGACYSFTWGARPSSVRCR